MKAIKPQAGESKLQKAVRTSINRQCDGDPRRFIENVTRYGCQSGMVGELIYYTDTTRFYNRHRREIYQLLDVTCRELGLSPARLFGDKWDDEDPLVLDYLNQNLLAWFAYEETAREIGARLFGL